MGTITRAINSNSNSGEPGKKIIKLRKVKTTIRMGRNFVEEHFFLNAGARCN